MKMMKDVNLWVFVGSLGCQISQIEVNYLDVVESKGEKKIEHTKIQGITFHSVTSKNSLRLAKKRHNTSVQLSF